MEGGHTLEEDAEAKLSWALKATVNCQNRKCVGLGRFIQPQGSGWATVGQGRSLATLVRGQQGRTQDVGVDKKDFLTDSRNIIHPAVIVPLPSSLSASSTLPFPPQYFLFPFQSCNGKEAEIRCSLKL